VEKEEKRGAQAVTMDGGGPGLAMARGRRAATSGAGEVARVGGGTSWSGPLWRSAAGPAALGPK
jgi:hypothetical protein